MGSVNHLTFLLTGPGELLVRLLLPSNPWDDGEARAHFAVTLGILFWIVVLVTLRFSWSVLRPALKQSAAAGSQFAQHRALAAGRAAMQTLRRFVGTWSWPEVWGATWRAQVVHVALYAGWPVLWESARLALVIMLLPFSILSFADQKRGATDGTLDHLARPACWTFVTPCAGPRSDFLHTPVIEASQCRSAGDCPPGVAIVSDFGGWGWKGLWAAISIVWIGLWLQKRRRNAAGLP